MKKKEKSAFEEVFSSDLDESFDSKDYYDRNMGFHMLIAVTFFSLLAIVLIAMIVWPLIKAGFFSIMSLFGG